MDAIKIIGNIAGDNQISVILKIVLVLLTLGAGFFIKWFIEKERIKAAHNKTEEDRAKNQAAIDDKNKQIFNDAKKSEDAIEDIIKKEGK